MRLFEAQAALFAPRPSRLALLGLDLPPARATDHCERLAQP